MELLNPPPARWRRWLLRVLAVLTTLLAAGWLLPRQARVIRTMTMRAAPEAVFERVATLRRWPEWTAWTTNRFPDLVYRFTGPESGVGATLIATGQSSGDGTVTLTRAVPAEGVAYTLDFNHGTQRFDGAIDFANTPEGLRVTWTLTADLGGNPLKRWGGLAMGTLMGGDMKEGLAKLKVQVEQRR